MGQRRYLAARLAWFYTHGVWPVGEMDHINRNRDDNRLCNLRVVTRKENCKNSGVRGHNRLRLKHITKHHSGSVQLAIFDGKTALFRKNFRCLGLALKARADALAAIGGSHF